MKSRSLSFVGIAVLSLLCATGASAQDLWSNPANWGGQVPGPGAHVVIPQTRRVILDVNPPPLGSITVFGVLQFAEKDIDLTVGWIMVHGLLEIGTEQTPYPHRATITLNGPLDQDIMGMGARFIGAMNGGVLEIHGSRRADVDWAVLSAHAKPGDTTMSLELVEPNKTVLGWRPGDLLVIAPSGRDPLEAEAVTVTDVSGTRVSFSPALRFHHWGALQTIAERTVDTRAEVGLLTRNIVIQGAPDGFARQMGGHVMIMAGSIGKLEGVELRRMGQVGRKGRYPIHWHLTGLAPTDYSRFNSIWSSFHRAVAVHQTAGVEVRGNVAADIWSHAYVVAEDGNEVNNIVEDNLGVLTKRLPDSAFAFARAGAPGWTGTAAQDEWRPATFWINNAKNVVRRNRAAGGLDAIGFYYDNDHGRAAASDVAALDFFGNVAHSYLASSPEADPLPAVASGVGLMVRMAPRAGGTAVFGNFTAYQNSVAGAWLENPGDLLQDTILADNASGAVIFRSTIDNALIVGQTNNSATPHPTGAIRGGVRIIGHVGGAKAPQVRRTTFVNQAPAAIYVESDHLMPGNLFEANRLIGTPIPIFLRDRTVDHSWSGGLLDIDGSLTGTGSPSVVTGYALSAESVFMPGCGTFAPGGAFVTPQPVASGPTGLTAFAEGSTVGLAWYPPSDPSGVESYVLEAGSAPGRADLAQADVGLTTVQAIPGVPNGTFFIRVRARGPGGVTQPSNEVQLVVGEPACAIPDPPVLTHGLDGRTITLQWSSGGGATSYVLGVGSASGRYDLLVTTLPGTATSISGAVPPGTYVVRMVAQNACGLSTLSNEVTIAVP